MELRLATPEKFWAVTTEGEQVTIVTGVLGTTGTRRSINAGTPEGAVKMAEALVRQRKSDGFVEAAPTAGHPAEPPGLEARLVSGDVEAWQVFADALQDSGEAARGEFILHQLRAERRVRGSIGQSKEFLKRHFDVLVGSELAAFHRQVSVDWRFGYAYAVKVWSGPYSAPVADVLEAVFASPASRFLRRLELGSPGAQGRYGEALRELSRLRWPKYLDSLVLGAFDLAAAQKTDSAWPIIESLSALQPAPQLVELKLRAVLNTFGQRLKFPSLERLWLSPSRVDARLLSDLSEVDAPRLRSLTLEETRVRSAHPAAVSRTLSQLLLRGLRELSLYGCSEIVSVLRGLDLEASAKLERLDLRDSLRVIDADDFLALAPTLSHVTLEVGPTLVGVLSKHFPRVVAEAERPGMRADE